MSGGIEQRQPKNIKTEQVYLQAADQDDLGFNLPAGDGEREARFCHWNF